MLFLVRRDEMARVVAVAPEQAPVVVASRDVPTMPTMPAAPAALGAPGQVPFVPQAPPPITLPADTQPLAAEFVPGTTEWEEVPLADDGAHVIRFLPAHYNVVAPAPIVLYLEVVDVATGKRVAVARAHARVRPFDAPDAWIDIPAVDDGTHRYVATLHPTRAQEDALHGHVVAEGIVETPAAGTRRIPQALIYTHGPRAHLTGRWRDERRDGHLYLSAEIEVEAPGTFTVMAELFGPAHEPIALVRATRALDRGTQWMELRAWGKALRDANIDGPYEVRDVLLTRDMNERGDYDPGPTIPLAHRTAPYHAADFSAESYVEPQSVDTPPPPAPLMTPPRPSSRS